MKLVMKRIPANFDRYIELDGVGTTSRPVDIDQSVTGFATLRTLRIYRFEPGSVIDGHAEEDEVFIIVLSGSVELTMSVNSENVTSATLAVAGDSANARCAAYLPPHAAYRLVPNSRADIAYVRATPAGSRPPSSFGPSFPQDSSGVTVLLDENSYAEKLRIRLVKIEALRDEATYSPIKQEETKCEALIHVRTMSAEAGVALEYAGSSPMVLDSWDTISVNPGERPTLRIARSSAFVLIALAS